jgi:thioredoxin-dependent peroxiredoxin
MAKYVTFKGNPVSLVGRLLNVGMRAPDFKVVSPDLKEVNLADLSRPENELGGGIPQKAGKGKIKVINSFLSLDTRVCDMQVKEFNKRAAEFSSDIVVLGISKDLPFAQQRFCEANNIKNALTFSDYKFSSFGINYGLLIKEMNLLARAVVIIDKSDLLRYFRIAEELATAPDYEDALKNLQEVIDNPALPVKEGMPSKCSPCEGGIAPLPKETTDKLLAMHRGWLLVEDKKITKEFKFKDFVEAKYFLDLVSIIAEEQGHHPSLNLVYNKLKIILTTHAAGGLTENDFIMAKIIDELGGPAFPIGMG